MAQNTDFVKCFKSFLNETSFIKALELFQTACKHLHIDKNDANETIYEKFRNNAEKLTELWQHLDKLRSDDVYGAGQIGKGTKVLIVGAGPCGLRMAIECALLGATTVVVEARDYLSRNNVLHLWPFVIHDIKKVGGKVLFRQFCTGGIDHISIKRLQYVLAKIALLLGVQIYTPVQFEGINEPNLERGSGWRVELKPHDHPVTDIDFDVIVGANGKSRTLPDFHRRVMRGKLAIAITANFKTRKTTTEARVQEIGGLNYLYNRSFFLRLQEEIGVELENIVYFKDETHYFVMTVKKKSLLEKGVLKENFNDPKELLARENTDQDKLHEFAREVANCSVEGRLPDLEYALNHHDKQDVAMFDFTALSVADYSSFVKERHGKALLQCIVGDSLLEPFWPTGSGAARGFLSVLDAAWLVRGWCLAEQPRLELIAERESLFQILVQTVSPRLLHKKFETHTIDPSTRYVSVRQARSAIPACQVNNLYNTSDTQDGYTGAQGGGRNSTYITLYEKAKAQNDPSKVSSTDSDDALVNAQITTKQAEKLDKVQKRQSAPARFDTKEVDVSDGTDADDMIFSMMGKPDSSGEEDYVPAGISKRLIDRFEAKCDPKSSAVISDQRLDDDVQDTEQTEDASNNEQPTAVQQNIQLEPSLETGNTMGSDQISVTNNRTEFVEITNIEISTVSEEISFEPVEGCDETVAVNIDAICSDISVDHNVTETAVGALESETLTTNDVSAAVNVDNLKKGETGEPVIPANAQITSDNQFIEKLTISVNFACDEHAKVAATTEQSVARDVVDHGKSVSGEEIEVDQVSPIEQTIHPSQEHTCTPVNRDSGLDITGAEDPSVDEPTTVGPECLCESDVHRSHHTKRTIRSRIKGLEIRLLALSQTVESLDMSAAVMKELDCLESDTKSLEDKISAMTLDSANPHQSCV